jgi:cardiolipin synthase
VKLIVQPDDGATPVVNAIQKAKKTLDIVIFRFDRLDLEKAIEQAVARGVVVRALIAHTSAREEKSLRKLEFRLLAAGVMVARTDDDLIRYHNKMMIVDRAMLYVLGFNYTRLDIDQSRSFGVVTKNRRLVAEAVKLFEADVTRQPYVAGSDNFIVSPGNARAVLAAFIKKARKQLLIYDPRVSDAFMLRALQERAKAGVDVRILGRLGKDGTGLRVQRLPGTRLHVRTIIRDGRRASVGSQSLRKLELDARREVGIIVREPALVKKLAAIFEVDWALTDLAKQEAQSEKDVSTG